VPHRRHHWYAHCVASCCIWGLCAGQRLGSRVNADGSCVPCAACASCTGQPMWRHAECPECPLSHTLLDLKKGSLGCVESSFPPSWSSVLAALSLQLQRSGVHKARVCVQLGCTACQRVALLMLWCESGDVSGSLWCVTAWVAALQLGL
jgi:hypothetical protein